MKTRHFILAVLALLCSATLLTACGSDDDNNNNDNTPAEDKTRAYVSFESFFIIKGDALDYLNIDITYDGDTHRLTKADLTSDGIYMFKQTVPMSALPTTFTAKQEVTVRDDVDFSNVTNISFSIGHYYKYAYLNAAKAVIDNQYYPSLMVSDGEGGETHDDVMEVLDDVRHGDFNKEFSYSFNKAGELVQ